MTLVSRWTSVAALWSTDVDQTTVGGRQWAHRPIWSRGNRWLLSPSRSRPSMWLPSPSMWRARSKWRSSPACHYRAVTKKKKKALGRKSRNKMIHEQREGDQRSRKASIMSNNQGAQAAYPARPYHSKNNNHFTSPTPQPTN